MSNKIKEKIKYNKNRVVLSDILPYELPIIFSNRYFYKFLTKHKVSFEVKNNGKYYVKTDSLTDVQKIILSLLINTNDFNNPQLITIPFNFKILHKENDFRELSIVHPLNQTFLIWFYSEFSEIIKYYCNISKFSIRKPDKVAKFKIRKDSLFDKLKQVNEDGDIIEESDKEYENLKTFFTYKKYSNIHKFFESYQYQRAEKKFNAMFKFDVSKCFDSIYTHSISWAVFNKTIVKNMINTSITTNNDFPTIFDELMQRLNYNETNGIVIGPEFSRIFAEIILQKIDSNVYEILKREKIYHKRDYKVFRYVDDVFVFYNDEVIKDKIFENYKLSMKEFKLYVNDNKSILYKKPIITELTIAKEKISKLIEKYLSLNIEDENENLRFKSYLNSQKLITKYKSIIKESNIEYKDILNWTFAIINRKIKVSLKKIIGLALVERNKFEDSFTKYILEVLDFSFFIYAVYPRTNITIKVSSVLNAVIDSLKKYNIVSFENKHLILKKISDEVIFVLDKYSMKKHTQIENSYLLITLSEMGRYYRLKAEDIIKYFNLRDKTNSLNYFSIVIVLFYIRDIKRYKKVKRFIKVYILKLLEANKGNLKNNTETILLLFDIISCPYLDLYFKKKVFNYFGIIGNYRDIISEEKTWFINWQNLNYKKELEAKKSMEVYS